MRIRSLRLRLTLWYVAILAVVLLIFSAAIYFTLRRSLDEDLTDSASNRAALALELIDFDANGSPSLALPSYQDNPDADEAWQRLYGTDGEVLFDNSALVETVDVDVAAFQSALNGGRDVSTEGGARVITQPVLFEGAIVGVLQTGEATDDIEETLNALLTILAVTVPAALILASLGGWWLAGRALAPIDRITRSAAGIGAGDLSRRLNLDLPDDEVGRLASTFDAMIARLDAAFQRQRQFTADASHELRTPLTAIRGQIDVALERPRDADEYRRVLTAVNEQVERMTRLVGGMLMLARSDAGAMPLQRDRVNVRALVESAAATVLPLAEERGLALRVEPGPDVAIVADEDLLLQLLLNLADNAVKYTPSGAITIGWDSSTSGVNLYVRDTGPGIPAERRERIFERFYRIDAARSGDDRGTGLGLAISRWIAEAHGGALRVEDAPEGGSSFVLAIPGGLIAVAEPPPKA